MITPAIDALIDLAIEEDLGRGDVTTEACLGTPRTAAKGVVLAKEAMTVFGLEVAARVFQRIDPALTLKGRVVDGAKVEAGTIVADVGGPVGPLLAAERPALNFLQRLSGVATQARRFVDAAKGTRAKIVDTRKTTPGWRALEKAAVRAGGASNHRFDLGSGILIKDNHIVAAGGVAHAVARARTHAPHGLKVEVEVTTLQELDEALGAGAELVLLDNMAPDVMREAIVRAHAKSALVEISGGVRLENVAMLAALGADLLSSGALTHSAKAVDLSLDLVKS